MTNPHGNQRQTVRMPDGGAAFVPREGLRFVVFIHSGRRWRPWRWYKDETRAEHGWAAARKQFPGALLSDLKGTLRLPQGDQKA